MKAYVFTSLLFLLGGLLLAGCATKSPSDKRIEKNPQYYGGLTDKEKDLVRRGQVAEGMSQDAVFLAWGRPNSVRSGSRGGTSTETWLYTRHDPVPRTSIGIGGVFGTHGRIGVHPTIGYGYGGDYHRVIERKVEFTNGEVTAWERRR